MNLKIKTGESSKKNSLKIAFLLYFLISVQFVFAQNQTIDLNMTDKSLSEIFKSIEKQADISVDFDETQINIHQKISVNIKNKKLTDALSMILSPLKYKYAIQGKHVIITNEKNRQKSESIVGFVKNPNGEPLIGASVLVKGMPYRPTSTDGFTSKPPRNPDWSFHTWDTTHKKLPSHRASQ